MEKYMYQTMDDTEYHHSDEYEYTDVANAEFNEEPMPNYNINDDDDNEEYKWNKKFNESQAYYPTWLDLADEMDKMPIVPETRKPVENKLKITSINDFSTAIEQKRAMPQVFTTRAVPVKEEKVYSKRKPERVKPNKQKAADTVVIDDAYRRLQAERRKIKRAKRKDEKKETVVSVVPRPTLFQHEWDIECEENLDIECETPTFEVIEKITYNTPVKIEKEFPKKPEPEPVEEEEEDDDCFAEMMAVVQKNKPQKKPVQPKVQAVVKPVYVPTVKPAPLEKTRMCISYGTQNKCRHGVQCRFAHSVTELAKRKCRYDTNCRYIHAEQPCEFWHGQETVSDYCKRLGIKV